jgi:hypothetical protein
MVIYLFDYDTGAYLWPQRLTVADINPRTHEWIVPGNSTWVEPPRCDSNTMPVWRGDRWEVFECVTEIPDAVLKACRENMEKMQPSGEVEKIK